MAYGNLNVDTITGSGASSVIVNNGTNNVAGFTTGNNLQMLQNGGGIVFSNSSATTNSTLNDYETGNWTPSAAGDTGTITSYSSGGTYVKIGKQVFLTGYINLTNVGSASGQLVVGTLPFSFASSTYIQGYGIVREINTTGYEYYINTKGNSTTLSICTSTNGGVTWTNNYIYGFSINYQATF